MNKKRGAVSDFHDAKCREQFHNGDAAERNRKSRAIRLVAKRYGRDDASDAVELALKRYPNAMPNQLAECACAIIKARKVKK